jgi:hypothetical protein
MQAPQALRRDEHDTSPLPRERATLRGLGGTEAPQAFRRGGNLGRGDLGPPVVPGVQEIGFGSQNLRPSRMVPPAAEARPTGRPVSMERLGDWNGLMEV